MRKFIAVALFTVLLVGCVGEAGAACGGGGWKKPPKDKDGADGKAAPASAAPAASAKAAAAPAAPAPAPAPAKKPAGFDAQFEAVVTLLKLDETQSKKVAKAREDIINQAAVLDQRLFSAEEKFARCAGPCEAETKEVNAASVAQKAYVPKAEFEKELKTILSAKQWDIYSGAKVSLKK